MKFSRNPLSRSLFSRNFYRTDPALPVMLFDADPGAGPGTPPVAPKFDVQDAVQKAIAELLSKKNDDPMAALETLIKRNHKLEERAVTAETALSTAQKTGLTDADKADLAALRELGVKPGEAKVELEAGRTAKGEAAETKRLATLEEAAGALGMRPSALKRLAPKSPVIVKQIDVKGEDGKVTKENQYFFKDGETEKEISVYFADDTEALELLAAPEAGSQQAPLTPFGKSAPIGTGKKVESWDRIRAAKRPEKDAKPAPSWQEQVGVRP